MGKRYAVEITRKAQKEIDDLDWQTRARVKDKIRSLAEDPRPNGTRKVRGWGADEYRIRVGDVRIVYEVDDNKVVVTVVKVEGRDKVYKKR